VPTGYTAVLQEEPDISLADFTLRCARAMGSCVMMRDDKMNEPLTKEKIAGGIGKYHLEAMQKARRDLFELKKMTPKKKEFHNMVMSKREKDITYHRERLEETKRLEKTYHRMLKEVKEWNPPSEDHVCLKNFMIKQIEESIDGDCTFDFEYHGKAIDKLTSEPDFEEEYNEMIADLERDIKYHENHYNEDVEKANSRIKWLADLYSSLGLKLK
jgi:hypothetical protein